MRSVLPYIGVVLIGVVVLQLGQGLLNLVLAVRMDAWGLSRLTIGAVMAVYFAGFVLGSLSTPRLVARVGHIRAFAAFGGMLGALALGHSLWGKAVPWSLMRLVNGYCLAGFFLVVESWLNARTPASMRGRVMSLYMVSYYLALGCGQFLLRLAPGDGPEVFVIAALFFCLAIVPVSLTRTEAPPAPRTAFLRLRDLFGRAPLGLAGSLSSGLVMGAFFALGPVFARSVGLGISGVGRMMGVTILAGLVLQFPIGRLSDRFDRRTVLLGIALLLAPASLGVILAAPLSEELMLVLSSLFGGLAATLYPLSVAHANDHVDSDELISASSTLVLASSIGATIGPVAAAATMMAVGPRGLFAFTGLVGVALATAVGVRMGKRPPLPAEEQGPYLPVPRTTTMVAELDPRAGGDAEAR